MILRRGFALMTTGEELVLNEEVGNGDREDESER